MKIIAALMLFAAAPAFAAANGKFPDKPDAVAAKITARCVDKGRTVEQSSPSMVVCSEQMKTAQATWLSFVGGISLTEPPRIVDRWIIFPDGEGSRVQASSQVNATRKNGTPWTMTDDKGQADGSFRDAFRELGGTPN